MMDTKDKHIIIDDNDDGGDDATQPAESRSLDIDGRAASSREDQRKEDEPTPQRKKKCLSFAQMLSMLGKGIKEDVSARKPYYAQDWTEVSRHKGRALTRIIAAAVYVFFASAFPAIAFGEQLNMETGGQMTIHHTLLSTGMCGIIQSVIGGQPLLIVGVAEPIVIIYHFMDIYCKRSDLNFTVWSAWACVWATAFLILMSVTNVCYGIKWFTRFCGESFGMLIAILFLQQSIKGLVDEFSYDVEPTYWQTVNGIFGLLLAFIFVWSSYTLCQARTWKFGESFIRAILADYGFFLMIIALSGLSFVLKGNPGVPQRIDVPPLDQSVWVKSGIYTIYDMGTVDAAQIVAAIIPGFVISVLFYFDHSVSSQLAQQQDFNVGRPSAYHWDLLVLSGMTLLCGLLGLPPVNGVLPQAPLHTKSLCSKSKKRKLEELEGLESGAYEDEYDFHVYENRLSNFIQAALCLGLFGIANLVLTYIPTSLIWAFFALLALESLPGSQFYERLRILTQGKKRRESLGYLEGVAFDQTVWFTVIQAALCLGIWAITVWTGLFGISFPLWIMALVPIRFFIIGRLVKQANALDPY